MTTAAQLPVELSQHFIVGTHFVVVVVVVGCTCVGPGGIFIQLNAMRVFDLLGLSEHVYAAGGAVGRGGFFSRKVSDGACMMSTAA